MSLKMEAGTYKSLDFLDNEGMMRNKSNQKYLMSYQQVHHHLFLQLEHWMFTKY